MKSLSGLVGPRGIDADVRGDLRQQMVADDHHLLLAQINHAMPGGVARRPDDLEAPLAHGDHVAVMQELVGLRHRIVLVGAHPRRPHPFDRVAIDGKAVAGEKCVHLGIGRRRRHHVQHPVDPLDFEFVQVGAGVA